MDGINGVPRAMRDFAEGLQQPDFSGVQSSAHASLGGAGGMEEAQAYAEANAEAVGKVLEFTAAVSEGSAAYKDIANGSAQDYTNADQWKTTVRTPLSGER